MNDTKGTNVSHPADAPASPSISEIYVHLVEPYRVLVQLEGAGRELNAQAIEDDSLAAAHILAGDVAIYDPGRRPRPGDVVLVYAGDDDGEPDWRWRVYDPGTMDADARDEWGRVPRVPGAVFGTLVGLVRAVDAPPWAIACAVAEEGGR